MKKIKIIVIFISVVFSLNSFPQKKYNPWNKLVEKNNCKVSFLFYSKADNYNNGIVIKIENKNNFKIKYRFTIIAKTFKFKKEKIFKGIIKAREILTGSNNTLFWIPKINGLSISAVGIKKWRFYKY